jgi:beta-fructofuranosidase
LVIAVIFFSVATGTGGVWCAAAESALGPYEISDAVQLIDRSLYSGRLVQERDTGEWQFLAFPHDADDGTFIGEIPDPLNVQMDGRTIALTDADIRANR